MVCSGETAMKKCCVIAYRKAVLGAQGAHKWKEGDVVERAVESGGTVFKATVDYSVV